MICTVSLDILSAWQNATGQTTTAAGPDETPELTGHTPPPLIADGLSPPADTSPNP